MATKDSRQGDCPGSGDDWQERERQDMPITCYRRCICCDTLQRVEMGVMVAHMASRRKPGEG